MSSNFLSVQECIHHHKAGSIFLDGSWHLSSRDGRTEFEQGPRIQNAHFFDIDDVATIHHEKNLPHMMPSRQLFAQVMDYFSITPDSHVILYGTEGCFSIPRAFYGFKLMGHDKVYMMDGSLKDWIAANGPIESGDKDSFRVESLALDGGGSSNAKYDKAVDAKNIMNMEQMLDIVEKKEASDCIIVDARSAGRFAGTEPEPRPGLRGGHMPGSFNVPFTAILDDENKRLRTKDEIIKIFREAGVDVFTEKNIVTSCGSGVTASWLAIALEECGRDPSKTYIYDGSWIEWASDENTPIVK